MRCDSGEWSSSTIAIGALFSVSGIDEADEYTMKVNENTISTSITGSRHRLHSSLAPRR